MIRGNDSLDFLNLACAHKGGSIRSAASLQYLRYDLCSSAFNKFAKLHQGGVGAQFRGDSRKGIGGQKTPLKLSIRFGFGSRKSQRRCSRSFRSGTSNRCPA